MRPIWSGALGFGIVTIPVRMFSAVREHELRFNQISRRHRKRIRYRKVVDGSEAPCRRATSSRAIRWPKAAT
jgi:non-homologous end joining protein Ku